MNYHVLFSLENNENYSRWSSAAVVNGALWVKGSDLNAYLPGNTMLMKHLTRSVGCRYSW